jgi:hypothetical protein
MGSERMFFEVFDRLREAVALKGFDTALARLGILSADHKRPSDIAAVAAEEAEDVVGGEPCLGGHRRQRLTLRQKTETEREGLAGTPGEWQ